MNKTLVPLAQDDTNFQGVAPSLFGTEFAKKMKDHVDQIRALRSVIPRKEGKQFFPKGPLQQRGIQIREGWSPHLSKKLWLERPNIPQERVLVSAGAETPSQELILNVPFQRNLILTLSNRLASMGIVLMQVQHTLAGRLECFAKKLGVNNEGPVGARHHTRLPYRANVRTIPAFQTTPTTLQPRTDQPHCGRDRRSSPKRGNIRSVPPPRRLLLNTILGSQEGRWSETSDQPEGPESVCLHNNSMNILSSTQPYVTESEKRTLISHFFVLQ